MAKRLDQIGLSILRILTGTQREGHWLNKFRSLIYFLLKIFWNSTSNAWHLLTYLTFIKPINPCLNYCHFLKQSVFASCYLDWLIKKIFSASIKLSLHRLHLLLDIPIHSLSEIMLNFAIFLQQCKNCKKNSLIWYLAMDTDKYKKWVNAT